MNNILKERLSEAITSKKNDITTYVWKGKKREVNGVFVQEEKRLVDCTLDELQRNYDYCNEMLYNDDKKTPGRYVLMAIIDDQLQRCNCELFLRWLEEKNGKNRFAFVSEIKRVIDSSEKEILENIREIPISAMTSGIPEEFESIPVNLVIEGGMDKLGRFSRDHITLNFILKQGVWLTANEMKELTIKDEKTGEVKDRLDTIKENLLPTVDKNKIPLRITPKGLSYSQLKAMITLKSAKYSELTTEQLLTLRNRILFSLRDDCRFHAMQWEERAEQISSVAASKGWQLYKYEWKN